MRKEIRILRNTLTLSSVSEDPPPLPLHSLRKPRDSPENVEMFNRLKLDFFMLWRQHLNILMS